MSKDPRVYLAHILECTERIERFTDAALLPPLNQLERELAGEDGTPEGM